MLDRGDGEALLVKLCYRTVLKKEDEQEGERKCANYAGARRDAAAGQVTRMSHGMELFDI